MVHDIYIIDNENELKDKLTESFRREIDEYKFKNENKVEKDEITLSFRNVGDEGGWRAANEVSIKNAAKDFGVNLIYAKADLSYEKQIKILNEFIDMKVDIIAFSPVRDYGFE